MLVKVGIFRMLLDQVALFAKEEQKQNEMYLHSTLLYLRLKHSINIQ